MVETRLDGSGRPAVSVGMLTFRRTDQLPTVLPPILAQLRDYNRATGTDGEFLVVDNDLDGSAGPVIAQFSQANPEVRYIHEPRPGIAVARQRCLEETAADHLLQFIDDDETPQDGWLASMIDAWSRFGHPAAVVGCVYPEYASPPSEFVSEGAFFVRPTYPTGTEMPGGWSSNLLVDAPQVRRLGVAFDPRLGMRGGEDTLFTWTIRDRGGRIIFCAEGVVLDLVPDERNSQEWVLRRAWHHGTVHSFLTLLRAPNRAGRLIRRVSLVGRGTVRATVGLLIAAMGKLRGSLSTYARGLRMHHRGRGIVHGAVVETEGEYKW